MNKIDKYNFEKSDFCHYFLNLYKDRGPKAFYQFLNRPHRRTYSRSIIKKYSPTGPGLEIGCGTRTIAPTDRTILSDAYSEHGIHNSIAKVFFKGDAIPYQSDSFEFILCEHVLEHISNPIKSLKEWIRVLRPSGHLFIFLPHKERTNDCYREITTLEHLKSDYENDVSYNDSFHFDEWKKNVIDRDMMPSHYKHLDKQKLLDSCSIHHHVWSEIQIIELLEHLNLKIEFFDKQVYDRRDSFLVVARK